MDQPKIERLLRLMKLLTSNVDYTISDVALRLGTSDRTIYRYIDTLKSAGFAVSKKGDSFKLSMESDYFKDISKIVHFTEEEGYIFNSLLDNLDDNNLLKANLRKKLATIYNSTNMAELVVNKDTASVVNKLSESIEAKKVVILKNYSSSHTKNVSDRVVEAFDYTTNYQQVWCYDIEDKKVKVFKTSRIGDVEILDKEWGFETKHKKAYIDIFRIIGVSPIRVKVKLNLLSYNLLTEEYPLSLRDIIKIDDKNWLLDTKVSSFIGIGRFIIGLADNVEIVDTPELQKYVDDFTKKYLLR